MKKSSGRMRKLTVQKSTSAAPWDAGMGVIMKKRARKNEVLFTVHMKIISLAQKLHIEDVYHQRFGKKMEEEYCFIKLEDKYLFDHRISEVAPGHAKPLDMMWWYVQHAFKEHGQRRNVNLTLTKQTKNSTTLAYVAAEVSILFVCCEFIWSCFEYGNEV